MELHADSRLVPMDDGHDLAVLARGRYPKDIRETVRSDHERVVARHVEWRRHAGEYAGAVVGHARDFPVHGAAGAHDAGAVRGADALVTEADAEDRDRGAKAADDIGRDPGLGGRAGAGRQDDVRGGRRRDLIERDRVVPADDGVMAQLAHVPREVVHERIIVVDEEDHASAAISARALSSVSRYSASGSESATIPPPTEK